MLPFCAVKYLYGKMNLNCEIHGSTIPRGATYSFEVKFAKRKAIFTNVFFYTPTQVRNAGMHEHCMHVYGVYEAIYHKNEIHGPWVGGSGFRVGSI